jgi:ABC-2 type transport system permease protein
LEAGYQALRGGGKLSQIPGPARLAGLHLKIAALNEMQYRANFWVHLTNSVLALATGLIAIVVVYTHTDRLNGWTSPELLTVMGVHLIVGGVLRSIVAPNIWRLLQDVNEGTLDYTLTRPADSQLLVSVREFSLWSLIDVILGAGVVVWGATGITSTIGAEQALAFLIALASGALIIYAIWIAAATLAFKLIQVDTLMQLLNGIYEAGRWPVGIYPFWLRGALTVVIPLAFAVTVPAQLISGRVDWWWMLIGAGVAVLALAVSRRIWRWGIRNYSGASA